MDDPGSISETIPLHDIASMYYYEPIGVFTLTGSELLEIQTALQKNGQSMYPVPQTEKINPEMTYTVALPQIMLWFFVRTTKISPPVYYLTDIQLRDAILQYFPKEF